MPSCSKDEVVLVRYPFSDLSSAKVGEVDGLPVDARMMPREVREGAHRLGLIPYVPQRAS